MPAIEIGVPVRSGGLGEVVVSNNEAYPGGSTLFGMTGWQDYAVMGAGSNVIPEGIDPTAALSVFGVTGLTAYFGLLDVGRAIRAAYPKGVDLFFDNVGGDILEAAIGNLALRGRVVLCGAIATYNDTEPRPGPRNLSLLISKRGRMEGFIILDYMGRANEAIAELAGWVMGGDIQFAVDVVDGLDSAPVALDRLFTGANQGKVMARL